MEKAIDRSKLVRKPVTVRVAGKTYRSHRWVLPEGYKGKNQDSSYLLGDNGQPLTVYHGTSSDFMKFDKTKIGSSTDEGFLGSGFYFSTDPEVAGTKPRIVEAKLKINRPLLISYPAWGADKKKIIREKLNIPLESDAMTTSDLLQLEGYDGVVLDYSPVGYSHKEIMVFHSDQVEVQSNAIREPYKKTEKSYKLFRVDKRYPGQLFPLFVDANKPVPFNEWVLATAGDLGKDGKVKSKLGPLAYRPGWHGGRIPVATHIGLKDKKEDVAPKYRNPDYVWAEVEMPADIDWQKEADRRGVNKNGKFIAREAHITDQVPIGGYYSYKTNSNMTGEWMIGGAVKVIRVLNDEEVASINAAAGVADLPRQSPLDITAYGFDHEGKPSSLSKSIDYISFMRIPVTGLAYGCEYQDCEWVEKQGFRKSLTWSGWKLQGRCKVHGMDISIENRKGSVRRGVDKDGHKWKRKMHYAYGYIRGTVGKDKDHLDCYLGPDKESRKVFIVHQNDPVTEKFDEDKVMLQFSSAEEAKAAYLKQYDRPGFFGSLEETDIDTFKAIVLDKKNHGIKLVMKKSNMSRRYDAMLERKYTDELDVGIKVEMEHTDDTAEAKRIALDHLREDHHYYSKLIAAGLVDEPEAIAAAKGHGMLKSIRLVVPILEKARKSPKLVPVKRAITRGNQTFMMTVWVLPGDAKKMRPGASVQYDLFDQPPAAGVFQYDLFDPPPEAVPELPEVKSAKEELKAVKEIVKTTDSLEEKDDAIARAINLASPETRSAVVDAVTADVPEAPEAVEKKPYEYTPGRATVDAGHGSIEVDDYTGVIPKEIGVFSPAKTLDIDKPSWIPSVDNKFFKNESGRLPFYKLGENRYLIQVSDRQFVLSSIDVLAATHDFYAKREKETVKRFIKEDTAAKVAAAKKWLAEHPDPAGENAYARTERYYHERVLDAKYKSRVKPFRVIGDNKMTWTQMGLIQGITKNKSQRDAWAVFHAQMSELKQKSSDMEIQLEDMQSTFSKGRETSYGEGGVKTDLLASHGVKVKRQNGDEITTEEIEQIKAALDSVFSAFGDKSGMARKYGLKISHSGDKLMHARRALGIYFPYYKAIGVTAQLGDTHMGFILSHEWAHFMDNYLGKNLYHYASDEQGSSAHAIAKKFRGSMLKAQDSDYQNRTCECFARAFEEYSVIKTGDTAMLQEYSSRAGQGNYVDPERFKKEIYPMIDDFLKEKSEMLKSMNVWMFKQ